jgi:hypothetical protein
MEECAMPTVTISPANVILAVSTITHPLPLTFTQTGDPSNAGTWSSSNSAVSFNGATATADRLPTGSNHAVTIMYTNTAGGFSGTTQLTIVPAVAATNKNVIVAGPDGVIYLVSAGNGVPAALYPVAATPDFLVGPPALIGPTAAPSSLYEPVPSVNYVTCVVANLEASNVNPNIATGGGGGKQHGHDGDGDVQGQGDNQ